MAEHTSSTVYQLEEVWGELQRMKEAQDLNSAWARIFSTYKPWPDGTAPVFASLHTLGTDTFLPTPRMAFPEAAFPLPVRREVARARRDLGSAFNTIQSICSSPRGCLQMEYRAPYYPPVTIHTSFLSDPADLAFFLQRDRKVRIYNHAFVPWNQALSALERIIEQIAPPEDPNFIISFPCPAYHMELYVNILEPGVFHREFREEGIESWRQTAEEFQKVIRSVMAVKRYTFDKGGVTVDSMDVKILADAPPCACPR
jgi:hypothetical protein